MACSPTSTSDISERELDDAVNHLVSGKRHLLGNDYVAAVASLQEACQLFSKKYGETANECAEPYLYYGKALLEFSRMETGVLGNALQGVTPEDDSEEGEDGDGDDDEEEEEDEQVENPDKVTGEEREQIIRDVEAAIDENSRDLEEKMKEMKKTENTNSELSPNDQESAKDTDTSQTNSDKVKEPEVNPDDSKKSDSTDASDVPMEVSVVESKPEEAKEEETSTQTKTEDSSVVKDEEASDSTATPTEKPAKKENEIAEKPVEEFPKVDADKPAEAEPQLENDKTPTQEKQPDNKQEAEAMQTDSAEPTPKETKENAVSEGAAVTDTKNENLDSDVKDKEKAETENDEGSKMEVQPVETEKDVMEGTKLKSEEASKESVEAEKAKEEQISESKLNDKNINGCAVDSKMEESSEESVVKSSTDSEVGDKTDTPVETGSEDVKETESSKKETDKEKLPIAEDKWEAENDQAVDEDMDDETEDKNESGTGEESESTGEKSQDEAAPLGEEAGPSTSTGKPKEESEDEVTNLQLAWEMLELSKVIFKRQAETDKTKELKVAEVLLKLGEVSIESENYNQAIEDLSECLVIQKKNLEHHDRALAETLYQIGLASSFNNQYELAIENFTNSMKVIEDRINFLRKCEEDRPLKEVNSTVPNKMDITKVDAKDSAPVDDSSKANDNKADANNVKEEPKVEANGDESREKAGTAVSKDTNEVGEKTSAETSQDGDKSLEKLATEEKKTSTSSENQPETKVEQVKSSEEKVEESKDNKDESMDTSVGEGKPDGDASKETTKDENGTSEETSRVATTETTTSKDVEDDDPWLDTKREIEELEGLLPDIKTKIEDTEDLMKNALQSIKEAALQRLVENSEAKSPVKTEEKVNAKPISNISHLVKRKRKPEEENSCVESNDLKKPRPSEEVEGNHVNGDTVLNGDSKPMETDESTKVKVVPMETQPEAKPSVA